MSREGPCRLKYLALLAPAPSPSPRGPPARGSAPRRRSARRAAPVPPSSAATSSPVRRCDCRYWGASELLPCLPRSAVYDEVSVRWRAGLAARADLFASPRSDAAPLGHASGSPNQAPRRSAWYSRERLSALHSLRERGDNHGDQRRSSRFRCCSRGVHRTGAELMYCPHRDGPADGAATARSRVEFFTEP